MNTISKEEKIGIVIFLISGWLLISIGAGMTFGPGIGLIALAGFKA